MKICHIMANFMPAHGKFSKETSVLNKQSPEEMLYDERGLPR
jgi:hypothetical protein